MRSMRQRLAAVTLLGGLTTLGLGLAAGPATAAVDEYCLDILGDAQSGSLQITTTPVAGSEVEPGSDITVESAWNAADFEETDRFVVCGSVNGNFNEAMSSQHKGLRNEGVFSGSATVPDGVAPGSDVCIVGGVKGRFTGGDPSQIMVSETRCFRTPAAVEPTTTTTTTATTAPADPIVEPAAVEAPAPAVEVAPAAEPAPLPELPRTGAGIDLLAGFGGISLALGGLTRFLGRHRPTEG